MPLPNPVHLKTNQVNAREESYGVSSLVPLD
jgi:hypothetical protein